MGVRICGVITQSPGWVKTVSPIIKRVYSHHSMKSGSGLAILMLNDMCRRYMMWETNNINKNGNQ